MKFIGIIIVFISCSMCGFMIDWSENNRLKELKRFIYAFELLKAEIDYRLTPLQEAALYVSRLSGKEVKRVFETFARLLEQKKEADLNIMWQQAIESSKAFFHLNKEDYLIIYEFSNACGYLDKNMQKRNIDMLIQKLQQELTVSESKYQKNTKLNKYLGVLVGACISIFLI